VVRWWIDGGLTGLMEEGCQCSEICFAGNAIKGIPEQRVRGDNDWSGLESKDQFSMYGKKVLPKFPRMENWSRFMLLSPTFFTSNPSISPRFFDAGSDFSPRYFYAKANHLHEDKKPMKDQRR